MPQMFPMNWLLMFLIFVTMYLLMTLFINYNYTHSPMTTQSMLSKTKLNWKW
uniref:ATP synthase complex subunit 8 n=1 Tax=Tropostreptus sigmatospinus TaxID=2931685 RepID=A0A8T9JAG3_9MYRI|nr:ATP synthase F0 subunit 8 [Tropostreptus sigmatospinus]UOF70351.1 ATP synthase F0 subunit 8 [Tropostreptus sigmatospinus]